MTQATLSVFEHTIETTNGWLKEVAEQLGWQDRHRAYQALRAVLHALRDRLSADDAAHLAAQLPLLVRGMYYEGYHPSHKPVSDHKKAEFLARVAGECADECRNTGTVTQAVLQVLSRRVAPGEIDKVKNAMPSEIRSLFP